jgi:V/A-type H+-transporting ATPase subunit C
MGLRAANEYGFVNARIRGMKSRFLTVGIYESLIQSSSYEDFIKALSSTYYGTVLSRESPGSIPSPDKLALILSADFAAISSNLSRTLTGRIQSFTTTYLEFFYSESIKTIIRGLHVGLDSDEILRFSMPTSPADEALFSELVASESVSKMIDRIPQWELKVALLTRMPSYEEYDSTAPLEVAVEEWHLKKLTESLEGFSSSEIGRVLSVVEPRVVLRNMLTGLRAVTLEVDPRALDLSLVRFPHTDAITQKIAVSTTWRDVFAAVDGTKYAAIAGRLSRMYEDTHDLTSVELAIEDHIAQRVKKQLTAFPFHLGTIIGFFSLKQYEVRNLRSIAVGVERGEPAEVIRRMIVLW